MSSNLLGILNTGRTGLFASQTGLSVTGNNIANVNTPGFSRQRAVIDALRTGGVQVIGTQRMRDEFVTTRLYGSNARLAARDVVAQNASQVEAALGGTDGGGLGQALRDFFNGWQDLSLQPGGSAERSALLGSAGQLSSAFGSAQGQLRQLREQIDQQIQNETAHVNDLTARIAQLNGQVGSLGERAGLVADPAVNNLLDQRDGLVKELSEIVPLRVITDPHDVMTIFIGDRVLLEGSTAMPLTTRRDESNGGYSEVVIDGLGGGTSLAGKLTDGKLAGLLQARDQHAGQALASIDRLAAQLARDMNALHRQGTGLDGVAGRDFFAGMQVFAAGAGANRGGAITGATSIADPAQLTFNDYEIRFTAPGTFNVVNATTGATLSTGNAYTSGAPIDFAGMRVAISNDTGAPAQGDVFKVNSYTGSADRIDLAPAVASGSAAIAAGLSSAPGDNRNAIAMLALRDQSTMGNPPSLSYEGYFDNLRVRQAMTASSANSALADEQIVQTQLASMSDSLSGVSLDEEATNLIQFQRAFQASSRVISAADELMQSLLQMI